MIRIFLIALCLAVLSACTSSNLGAGLNEQVSSQPINPTPPADTDIQNRNALAAENSTASGQQVASLSQDASGFVGPVTFLPVTGAPQTAVSTLSNAIRQSATSNSVGIVPSSGGSRYEVKGYFSALDDGNGTLLVYVWDILDKSGKRVHRISGQERTTTKSSDPWNAIKDDEINRMANSTMANLKDWLGKQG